MPQFPKYYDEVQQIIKSIKFMHPEKQPIVYNGTVKIEAGSDILLRAKDPGNRSLTFLIVREPSKGALLLSRINSTSVNATYFPSSEKESGTDSFSYKVNNGILDSKVANVSLTFVPKLLQEPDNTTSNVNNNVSSSNQETNATDLESSSNNMSNSANPEPTSTNPAQIEILVFNVDHTSGYIFNTNWVAWGEVENTGGSTSDPVSVQIDCTNTNNGAPLYSNTIPVNPSVLEPGQRGKFSQSLSSERDLAGTKYFFHSTAKPVQ
jgi:hypothetical protein